jgi:ABC-2 type transport system permease protein
MQTVARELAFLAAYFKANLKVALEYRVAFWSNVLAMVLNDAMWVVFWAIFFTRFPEVRGYDLRDVLTVWAVAALGFGVATGIFGNCTRFAPLVAEGRLDFYLLLPRPPLFHLLISHMSISAWGDALFGLGLYLVVVRPSPLELVAFLVVSLAAGAIIAAHATLANSLAFWLGQAEGVSQQLMNALIMFSTYPTTLFTGLIRVVLFTAIPAGFIAYVPVRFLREFQAWQLASVMAVALVYVALAGLVFDRGLRRYESGNLVAMRS